MKEVATLKDLMALHLISLHETELQWGEAVKESTNDITSKELRKIFEASAKRAAGHAQKLKSMLDQMKQSSLTRKNAIVKDIAREMKDLLTSAADREVLDAGLIVTHQCMNHYMIAKYGTVASYARLLQQEHIANALHEIMEEEKSEDEELSRLAEEKINVKAKTAIVF